MEGYQLFWQYFPDIAIKFEDILSSNTKDIENAAILAHLQLQLCIFQTCTHSGLIQQAKLN